MIKIKQHRCKKCGRPINHEGNCLKCNLIAKQEKKEKIAVLISEILKFKFTNHKEIQLYLQKVLRNLGYFVELEKKIKTKRPGRIDLFAIKNNYSLGIEIDHSLIRMKSINKLNTLRPNLAIFILKSRNVNIKKNESRLGLIRIRSLLIYLSERKIQSLNRQ